MLSTQEILIRLLVAVLFCGSVGLQRALTGKAAGMRTHILVGIGAALFTLISGYAFRTSPTTTDRIAAQIVSGIGFIGGGAILKERGSIKGLTTAAGLWAAAALGMAAGAGLYVMGALSAILILVTLVVLRRVELHFPRRAREPWVVRITLNAGATTTPHGLRTVLTPYCQRIALIALTHDDVTRLTFAVELPHHVDLMSLTERLRAAGAHAVTWQAHGGEGEDGP